MQAFDHVAFQVSDIEAAIRFYEEKLGFALKSNSVNPEEQEAYAFLTLGDVRLELLQDLKEHAFQKPVVKPPYCPHLAIETDDMEGMVRRLKQAGVELLRGPLAIEGEETWVYFTDPDNNVLEYIQWFRKK